MGEATESPFAAALHEAEAEIGQSVHEAMDAELAGSVTPTTTPEPAEIEAPAEVEASEVAEAPVTEAPVETPEARTYTVKVDGQTTEVSEDELVNGYQRQADYTRKTQELAAERTQSTAILEALQNDPQGTLLQLASELDIDLDTLTDHLANVDDDQDPLEAKVAELSEYVTERQQEAQEQAIFSEIDALKAAYGDTELDPIELLDHAVSKDIGDLEEAYKSLAYDKLAEQVKAERAAQAATVEAQVTESKRTAPPIEGGAHRNGNVSTKSLAAPKSIAAAWDAAVEELGAY